MAELRIEVPADLVEAVHEPLMEMHEDTFESLRGRHVDEDDRRRWRRRLAAVDRLLGQIGLDDRRAEDSAWLIGEQDVLVDAVLSATSRWAERLADVCVGMENREECTLDEATERYERLGGLLGLLRMCCL